MQDTNQNISGMAAGDKLPPMPASDPEAIAQNKFSGFYYVGARDFWKYSRVSLNHLIDKTKCTHKFTQKGSEAVCDICHVGYQGSEVRAQDGKLFISNNETIF